MRISEKMKMLVDSERFLAPECKVNGVSGKRKQYSWEMLLQCRGLTEFPPAQNGDRLGTLMLMSPMLMLRGISGRFMFFTAETARAGAAESPP